MCLEYTFKSTDTYWVSVCVCVLIPSTSNFNEFVDWNLSCPWTPCSVFLNFAAAVSNHNHNCHPMANATREASSCWHHDISDRALTPALLCTKIGHPGGRKASVSSCYIFCCMIATHLTQLVQVWNYFFVILLPCYFPSFMRT